MRTTQYIGLTSAAQRWVEGALRKETYEIYKGWENVYGSVYYMPPPEGPNKVLVAREVVQASPWSSGPMIFTHLLITLIKDSGQEIDCGFYYSWVVDPMSKESEYDPDLGTFFV
jgi:hypothetical protein